MACQTLQYTASALVCKEHFSVRSIGWPPQSDFMKLHCMELPTTESAAVAIRHAGAPEGVCALMQQRNCHFYAPKQTLQVYWPGTPLHHFSNRDWTVPMRSGAISTVRLSCLAHKSPISSCAPKHAIRTGSKHCQDLQRHSELLLPLYVQAGLSDILLGCILAIAEILSISRATFPASVDVIMQ